MTSIDWILADFQDALPSDWSLRRLEGPSDDSQECLFSGGGFEVQLTAGDRLILSFAPHAMFEVDRILRTCALLAGRDLTPATLQHLLFDQILPRLIAHAGRLVLHASAVGASAGAILFLGGTGQGKSTLAASFGSTVYD